MVATDPRFAESGYAHRRCSSRPGGWPSTCTTPASASSSRTRTSSSSRGTSRRGQARLARRSPEPGPARLCRQGGVRGADVWARASVTTPPSSSTATATTGTRATLLALQVLRPRDARIMNGGRAQVGKQRVAHARWRAPTPTTYTAQEPDERHPGVPRRRAGEGGTNGAASAGGRPLAASTPARVLHMPDYPQEGALRGGHIPGAKNIPWKAANEDGTFKSAEELREHLRPERASPADKT